MSRLAWWMAGVFGLLLLMVLAVEVFFGFTERGLRQLAAMGVGLSRGALTIECVQGRLLGQWRLEGVRVQTPVVDVICKQLEARWQPLALITGTARMLSLRGEGVDVRIKEEGMDDSPLVLPHFLLPVGVALDSVELDNIVVHGIDGIDLPPVEKLSLTLAARRDKIDLKKIEATVAGGSAHLQGVITLDGDWPLDLRGGLRLEEAVTGTVVGPVAADVVIGGTSMNPVAQLDVQTPVQTRVNLAFFDLFGDLRWQADTILNQFKLADMDPDWPELVLKGVEIKVSGIMDEYQGAAQAAGVCEQLKSYPHLASLPRTPIHAEFSGNFDGLRLLSVAIQLPEEGLVTAQGKVDWQNDVNWQVELEGKDVNLEPYFPGWQCHVNTRIDTSARMQDADFSSQAVIVALDGDLLGYPLSGSGSVSVDNDTIQIRDVLLQSGETKLAVAGTIGVEAGSSLDLRLQGDVADLGNLLPEAKGTARIQGAVQGNHESPEFSFELEGKDLSYQENLLKTLAGRGRGTISSQGEMDVSLAGEGLRLGGRVFTALSVSLRGAPANHQIQIRGSAASGDMEMEMAGGFEGMRWQGEISRSSLRLDPYGDWLLQNPAQLRVDGKGVELSSACLRQGEASLCLEGAWQASDASGDSNTWWLNSELASFACDKLYQWRLLSLPVQGQLAAFARAAGEGHQLVKGEARVSAAGLQMTVQDENGREHLLRWQENLLHLELIDDKLVARAQTRLQDGSGIDANLSIGGFGDLSAAWGELPLTGEIDLDIKDFAPLEALSDYALRATGAMKGAFAVNGQVGNPLLSGKLRQVQGNIFIPATGITLEKLLLSVMVKDRGEGMSLTLDAASGPGSIQIAGAVEFSGRNGWQLDATATGRNFEVAHLPEYEILINPELRLAIRDKVIHLDGTALVPRAVIVVSEIDGSVSASRDVILLDGGRKDEKMDLPLKGAVNVELGEEVNVDVFGLKGKAQGSVMVSDAPGLPMTGKGTLTLHDGIYVVKDRALDIARGRFSFLGGPLENPVIDVLAQKKNDNRTVGVLVSGTVQDMDLKLFSDPPMPESQILSELLSGRSYSGKSHLLSDTVGGVVGTVATGVGFESGGSFVKNILSGLEDQFLSADIYMENGEGSSAKTGDRSSDVSVVIGRELFKDLFISYGYDPFSAAGIFRARYKLWKGLSVETEVGAVSTGADLLWSIEK